MGDEERGVKKRMGKQMVKYAARGSRPIHLKRGIRCEPGPADRGNEVSVISEIEDKERVTFWLIDRACSYDHTHHRYPAMRAKMLSGAVVSEQQRASEIGTKILAKGGNAADAIVATIIAVNTLSMYHSDIGGGGFAIIRTFEGEYESLNFRHCAPVSGDDLEQGSQPDQLTSIQLTTESCYVRILQGQVYHLWWDCSRCTRGSQRTVGTAPTLWSVTLAGSVCRFDRARP